MDPHMFDGLKIVFVLAVIGVLALLALAGHGIWGLIR